jgi:hypothetical protein
VIIVPDPPAPPPPPPPEAPVIEGTSFEGTIAALLTDGSSGTMDITLTGNIPTDTSSGDLSASGTYTMSGSPKIISGDVEGTSSTDGAFYGLTGGVIGSWGATSASLYVEGGNVGLVRSSLTGTLTPIDSSSGTLSGSGTIGLQKSLGTVTLDSPGPEETLLDVFKDYINSSTPYPSSFSGPWAFGGDALTLDVSGGSSIDVKGITTNEGGRISIIREKALGVYTNTGPYSLAGGIMGFWDDASGAYLLGPAVFVDDGANKMSMAASYDYMDYWYLGTRDMLYYGTYDGDPTSGTSYRWMGTGTQVLTPLDFHGYWGGCTLYYNDYGVMTYAGTDYGYLGGLTPPWTSPASFYAMGEYGLDQPGEPHYLMNSSISGSTTADMSGGSITGFTGAIWKDGTPTTIGTISDGTLRAVYASTPDGSGYVSAGIMKSDFTGSYYPFTADSGMWATSGTLTPTSYATGLNPYDLSFTSGTVSSGGLSGDFGGLGAIASSYVSGQTKFLDVSGQSLPFGIINIQFIGSEVYQNYYDAKPTGNPAWNATIGSYAQFASDFGWGFLIASASGTWTDTGEITGSVTGKAMTPLRLYDVEGKFSGVNTGEGEYGEWIGQVIGSYYNGTDLRYFSYFSGYMLNAANDDGIHFEYLSNLSGYLGGTASLWSGSDIPVTIMGLVGGSCLWYTSSPLYSYNVLTYLKMTYDGGAYYGLAGGSEYSLSLAGEFIALYIDNSGTPKAGVLKAGLSGSIYDTGMFEMDGLVNRTEKSTNIGISASDLYSNVSEGSLDGTRAYLSGILKNGATTVSGIAGEEDLGYPGATYAIATQPWGIYGLPMVGGFTALETVPTSWEATVGSTGTFGKYLDGSLTAQNDSGYWLAAITGTVPTGATTTAGRLLGTLDGTYITYTRLGTMDGDVYGTYEYTGLWKAAALGTWTGTDLTFVNEIYPGLFHYSTAWDSYDGYMHGLMGGTGTLWTGSPVAVTMISKYYSGDGMPKIWNDNIYSYNYKNSTYTTYDGGAYNGFFAGRVVGDDLYGREVAIYIGPMSGGKYVAGYLRGNLTGMAYADIYMAEMSGNLLTTPKNTDIGIAPESLTYSPWSFPPSTSSSVPPLWVGNNVTQPKSVWGMGTGWEIMSSGNTWNYTMALYNTTAHTAEPWGIYTMSHGGTVSGTPPAGWTGTIGGSGIFGAYYSTPQATFNDDYGYYLATISNGTWTDNSISGDVAGRFITWTKMGSMTGNLIGSYGAETGKWEAANIGVWEGSQPYFMSAFAPYFQYFDGTALTDDVFMNAKIGGTGSLFAGGTPAFTAIGTQGMPNTYGHIWGQRIYSASPATGKYTTYDGGAYWSYLGGILYPCGGTGVRSMLGSWYGLYIAPSASAPYAAGYFTGDWTGSSYWYLGAFELDGTVTLTQQTSDVGSIPTTGDITPDNFYEIVRKRYFAPNIFNYFVYGSFGSGEGYISGERDFDIMHIPGQDWGIYMAKSGGWYDNPLNSTTWSTVTGGRAQFGSYNLDTMTGGIYSYSDNGYYRYSYFNDYSGNPTGRNQLGFVSYRGSTSGYEKVYMAGGGLSVSYFSYGDPYGRGRDYWYYAGSEGLTWTGDLATIIAAAPGGWDTYGTGSGTGQNAYFIADSTGSVEDGMLTGTESGTYMGQTMMGTFSGDLLGTLDSETYQTITFGTWSNDYALKFYSGFLNYMYYGGLPDGAYNMEDGYMWFTMGGTDSLFGASTSVNASIIGEYVSGDPLLNHIWYTPGPFQSVNRIDGTNTTYDGGAYRGYAGATIIPDTTTDTVDFRSYMVYVDGSGNTGVLYSSVAGTGYPESMVFEGSGTITRTQLGTSMPFAPEDLVANTQTSTGPKTTDWGSYPPYGSTDSEGGFFDANFTKLGNMTERWDKTEILSFIEPYNSTYGFGLWKMNSLGAYDPSISPSYYHLNSDQIWTNSSPFYLTRYLRIDGWGTWSDGKLESEETYGYWANWRSGRTAILAGQTIGTYNDSEGAFSALSMGTWFGTPVYMNLANDAAGRQALAALGFPSELTTTVTLTGSQPSLSGTDVNLPINIYSYATPPSGFAHKVAASNSISGTYYGQYIDSIGNIVVTNLEETFFGSLWISQAAHSDSSGTDNWIGELWGMGAIQVGSSYIQGDLNGYGAGQFTGLGTTSGTFNGTLAGEFFPVWYMSWITPNASSKTRLYTYNGETGLNEDGYFKGVFDGNGPLDLWTTSESQPLDISMIGIYKNNLDERTSPTYASHVFDGELFSMNYTNSTNTTLDGGAYWGVLVGIQRDYYPIGEIKNISGYVGGLYISPTGKAGALLGYFGEVGDNYDWGWFDPNNAQWQAGGEWYAVELGTSSIAPENLTSSIYSHVFYYNPATSGGNFGGSGYITPAATDTKWAESFWISDVPNAGLWATKFYGSYYDPSGGTSDWRFEVKGATSTTDDLGVLISGGPWVDKKFEGGAVGYWASIEDVTGPSTGVLAGRVLGTFDVNTYMAIGIGSWVETTKFLDMAATEEGRNKLAQMNIPAVQVGMADLKGAASGIDMSSGSYGMTGVKFFSATNGGAPQVWATNSVSGAYTSNPVDVAVPLSGGGLNASFTMQQMNTNKWLAGVNGSGSLTSGGNPTYTGPIQFKGAGAGTYTGTTASGTFTGTAAGVAKPATP